MRSNRRKSTTGGGSLDEAFGVQSVEVRLTRQSTGSCECARVKEKIAKPVETRRSKRRRNARESEGTAGREPRTQQAVVSRLREAPRGVHSSIRKQRERSQ